MGRKSGGNLRSEESMGQNQGKQKHIETQHEWECDDDSNKDDRYRVQMTNDDDTARHSQEAASQSAGC